MKTRHCPQCDTEMEYEEDDPSVGIVGGWYCTHCDVAYPSEDEDFDDGEPQ